MMNHQHQRLSICLKHKLNTKKGFSLEKHELSPSNKVTQTHPRCGFTKKQWIEGKQPLHLQRSKKLKHLYPDPDDFYGTISVNFSDAITFSLPIIDGPGLYVALTVCNHSTYNLPA